MDSIVYEVTKSRTQLSNFHFHTPLHCIYWASQVAQWGKNPLARRDAGDAGSIPGSDRSPGGGHSNPLQYSCLENPMGKRSLDGLRPHGQKESDVTGATEHASIYNILKLEKMVLMNLFSGKEWRCRC